MRILIVQLSPIEAKSSATISTLGLVKGLIESNCVVDYLTAPASINHLKSNNKILDKINIIRTQKNQTYDTFVKPSGKLKKTSLFCARKLFHFFCLYDYSYSIAKNIDLSVLVKTEYDLIISSSDPKTSHIAVQNLIKQGLQYKCWIQHWGDPMTLDIARKSVYPKKVVSMIEEKLLLSADKIVYVSPFTLKEQKKLFPNLADKMFFLPLPYIERKIYKHTNNKKFSVGYFGDYKSKIRNIMPLYNACMCLKDVYLNVAGTSDLLLKPTENIIIYPRGDVSQLEQNSDLLICILNKKGSQIPGKLYYYAATNKPILVLLDGENRDEMRRYLRSFNRYLICNNDMDSIMIEIQGIMNENISYQPAAQFSAYTIATSLLKLMD